MADLVDDMDFPLPEAPTHSGNSTEGFNFGQQEFGGMRVVKDASQFKKWICLYPLYFDKSQSLENGRRVPLSLAVDSPHGKQLSVAAKEAGFNVCYEPHKTHPADFFNPGRVRVQLRQEANGGLIRRDIQSKKQLLKIVAEKMSMVDVPREKEPCLQDLIDSGALPALPGMSPSLAGNTDMAADVEASSSKPSGSGTVTAKASKKAGKSKKKGKAKTIV
ncbi:signal recognition particle, SRP19 subunit [Coemansia reversa NRRL 1564]|uniref:Signal recognition particle, SRP19 subunit n=1 Tax=Coemansia reversa (strain ATCC 12441 / NRRL 1564) TaxID=763665 RepID=A0A2G5BL39_COERN|nr:signal recognition particle, SRP19 subunit [Coemansia reversa NRRL 1564]|eukprot:PIA19729.1 signal recognition particle, SRP19 subunit [Coemansia reversa NRRL 1564]